MQRARHPILWNSLSAPYSFLVDKLNREPTVNMAWGGPTFPCKNFSGYPRPTVEDVMYGRQLEWVKYPTKNQYQLTLRVMSYNVLADHLLWENKYLYADCQPHILLFDYRKKLIIQHIKYQNPAIVCLQEVDAELFDSFYLKELSNLGYDGRFVKRTGDKHDGVAIFYKEHEFKMLKCVKIEYFVNNAEVLDRDNVGLVMALQPLCYKEKRLPVRFCVANTHLLYNTKRGDVKLAQLAYLFAHLHELAQKPGMPHGSYYPCFLCGDMNATPYSALYKFITSGSIDYSQEDKNYISGQVMHTYGRQWLPIYRNILPDFISHQCTFQSDRPAAGSMTSSVPSHTSNTLRSHCSSTKSLTSSSTTTTVPTGPSVVTETTDSSKCQSTSCTGNSKRNRTPSKAETNRSKAYRTDYLAFPNSVSSSGIDSLQEDACPSNKQESVSSNSSSDCAVKATSTAGHWTVATNQAPSVDCEGAAAPLSGASNSTIDAKQQHCQATSSNDPVIVTNGEDMDIEERSWGKLSHQFKFQSTYKHRIERLQRNNAEVTTKHSDNGGLTVDYIFYTGSRSKNDKAGITLLSRYGLLSSAELEMAGGIPNAVEPSDHLPLVAEYTLHK